MFFVLCPGFGSQNISVKLELRLSNQLYSNIIEEKSDLLCIISMEQKLNIDGRPLGGAKNDSNHDLCCVAGNIGSLQKKSDDDFLCEHKLQYDKCPSSLSCRKTEGEGRASPHSLFLEPWRQPSVYDDDKYWDLRNFQEMTGRIGHQALRTRTPCNWLFQLILYFLLSNSFSINAKINMSCVLVLCPAVHKLSPTLQQISYRVWHLLWRETYK